MVPKVILGSDNVLSCTTEPNRPVTISFYRNGSLVGSKHVPGGSVDFAVAVDGDSYVVTQHLTNPEESGTL